MHFIRLVKKINQMNFKKFSILSFFFVMTITPELFGEVVLPKILGHNMVLQREKAIPIWGIASKGEKITVMFAGQRKETVADDSGKWMIRLNPMEASGLPGEMVISGINTIKLQNILVG